MVMIGIKTRKAQEVACMMTGQIAPTFKERWWHSKSRIDIRPVVWSIRNRPDDWELSDYCFVHTPTRCSFWIANGKSQYKLYRAPELWSDTDPPFGKLSFIQRWQFSEAFFDWKTKTAKNWRQLFSDYFVKPRT